MHAFTAAHRTLRMNTRVRVTHLGNGRQVVVRINDRGPYSKGRIIDLSYAAARALDMIDAGVARVRLEVVP
jgi:rare lipoprotein A